MWPFYGGNIPLNCSRRTHNLSVSHLHLVLSSAEALVPGDILASGTPGQGIMASFSSWFQATTAMWGQRGWVLFCLGFNWAKWGDISPALSPQPSVCLSVSGMHIQDAMFNRAGVLLMMKGAAGWFIAKPHLLWWGFIISHFFSCNNTLLIYNRHLHMY